MKTTVTLSKQVFDKLVALKLNLSAKEGKYLTWDEFFERLMKCERWWGEETKEK